MILFILPLHAKREGFNHTLPPLRSPLTSSPSLPLRLVQVHDLGAILTLRTLHLDALPAWLAELLDDVIQVGRVMYLEYFIRDAVEDIILARAFRILDQVDATAVVVIEERLDDAVGILFNSSEGPKEFVLAVLERFRVVAPMWSGGQFDLWQVSVLL